MIVLLHIGDQVTLAELVRLRDPDTADLRAFSIYEDGRIEPLEIAGAKRGLEVGQWRELPGVGEPLPAIPEPEVPAVEPLLERATTPAAPPPRMPAIVIMRG